ncbi:MAG TPA: hypothetical protein VHV08_04155 [Pirellulales bacterium]|nr:hypothetical protein [Pirellulales bacterium]
MPSPLSNLEASERKVCSQNGEDGVIEAIFAEIGVTNRFCVEFGCENGSECNTVHLLNQGWSGLLMDCDVWRHPNFIIYNEFVTAENIDSLLRQYQVPHSFDLLSIDIDGNDFWVWMQIRHRPRLVVIEYNSHVPAQLCRSIRYDPGFQWVGTDYFGASLLALKELGLLKGYTLVHCEQAGANAFFIADEALPAGYVPRPIEQIYRKTNYFYKRMGFVRDQLRTMIDPFALLGNYFQIDVG